MREAELTYKEFVILGVMINMDISYLIHLLNLSFKYGPGWWIVVIHCKVISLTCDRFDWNYLYTSAIDSGYAAAYAMLVSE